MLRQFMEKASTPRRLAHAKPRLEVLEDRTLLSTCHVTRKSDANSGVGMRGTLRFCINKVNDLPGPDTIDFHFTGTITLKDKLPKLSSDIDIIGPGADLLTLTGDSNSDDSFFRIDLNATVGISGLKLSDGFSDGPACGITNNGTLNLKNSTIADCLNLASGAQSGLGGGISNKGKMTISGCTISGNLVDSSESESAYGGGIYNVGDLEIQNSTISGNRNDWGVFGAGIYNSGWLDIHFSTITAHTKGGEAIYNASLEPIDLYNSIVAGNTDGDIVGPTPAAPT